MKFSDIKIGDKFYFNGCLFYKHTRYTAVNATKGRVICFDGSEIVL